MFGLAPSSMEKGVIGLRTAEGQGGLKGPLDIRRSYKEGHGVPQDSSFLQTRHFMKYMVLDTIYSMPYITPITF